MKLPQIDGHDINHYINQPLWPPWWRHHTHYINTTGHTPTLVTQSTAATTTAAAPQTTLPKHWQPTPNPTKVGWGDND